MSLKQKVRLDLEDGQEIEVVFDGRDLRAWETKNRRSSISEPLSISFLSWLGWHAAERQHLLNGEHDTWEKFDAVCTGVEGLADDEDEQPDPTPGEASPPTASES